MRCSLLSFSPLALSVVLLWLVVRAASSDLLLLSASLLRPVELPAFQQLSAFLLLLLAPQVGEGVDDDAEDDGAR